MSGDVLKNWGSDILRAMGAEGMLAELLARGVDLTSDTLSPSGYINFHSPLREDKRASCGVNCNPDANGQYGNVHDFAGGKDRGFFQFLGEIDGKPFDAVRDELAQKYAVPRPKAARKKRVEGLALDQLFFRRPEIIPEWAAKRAENKPGLEVEAILRLRPRAAEWPYGAPDGCRFNVLAYPGFIPPDFSRVTAVVLVRVDGKKFPAIRDKDGEVTHGERSAHTLAGSVDSLIVCGSADELVNASKLIVEGISDLEAWGSILPSPWIGITNTAGAAGFKNPAFASVLSGEVASCLDRDDAGVDGQLNRAMMAHPVANRVRCLELPYPVKPSHGDDLRQWKIDGATPDDLQRLLDKSSDFSPDDPATKAAILSRELDPTRPEGQTDVALGKQFLELCGKQLCHVAEWKTWLHYDGAHWVADTTGTVEDMAKLLGRRLWEQVNTPKAPLSEDVERSLKKAAFYASTIRGIRNFLSAAASERAVAETPPRFNSDPWALNCVNGTVDLRTGNLRPHSPGDYLTTCCPTPYDAAATAPTFDRFMLAIMCKNVELVAFLQRLVGYFLTGDVREQLLAIFWGKGSNGKSTFLCLLERVLGPDYFGKAVQEFLVKKSRETHHLELASLYGKRLLACVETGEGRSLDEVLVKELCGGDSITARFNFQNFFTFQPTHKPVLVSNHKPIIRGTDHGIWRRLCLVPFEARFWDANKGEAGDEEYRADKTILDRLQEEAPGILRWAVDGCLAWQRDGLQFPDAVRAATKEYRTDQDRIGQFLNEACLLGEAAGRRKDGLPEATRAAAAYAAYARWCKSYGDRAASKRRFGEVLTEKADECGFARQRSNGISYSAFLILPEWADFDSQKNNKSQSDEWEW